jgi:hypothetical protein
MEPYKIVGAAGACILMAGVFMPSRVVKMAGYISYYTDHQMGGVVLAVRACIALILVFVGSPTKLFLFGGITLSMVAWAYLRRNPGVQLVEDSVGQWAAQAAALPLVQGATDSITNNTPWWIMLGGSALLVIAGLMQVRKA